MSKLTKSLVVCGVLVILGIGVILGYVSTKINPIEIKKTIIAGIESNLPGTKAKISKVEFNLGLSSSFGIDNLEIKDSRNKVLLNSKNININVPIWSIITGGGNVDVLVGSPEINFTLLKDGSNNWYKAIEKKETSKVLGDDTLSKTKTVNSKIEIPSFIKNSKLNFSLEKAKVNFVNINKSSVVNIDKVLFKNLSLTKSTAYEVVSKIDFEYSEGKSLRFNSHLVGEVDFSNYLNYSRLTMSSLLSLKNIKITGMEGVKIPSIKNVFKLEYDKNKSTLIDNRLEIGQLISTKFKASLSRTFDQLAIKSLEADLDLSQVESVMKMPVTLREGILKFFGDFTLDLNEMSFNPSLTVSTAREILVVVEGQGISSSITASFRGEKLEVNLNNKMLDGELKAKVNTSVDLFNLPSDITRYPEIKLKIEGADLKLSRKYISSVLYTPNVKKEKTVNKESGSIQEDFKADYSVLLPPVDMTVSIKNIQMDNKIMNMESTINTRNSHINSKFTLSTEGKGKMSGVGETTFNKQNISNKINFNINKFDFINMSAFLPPFLSELKGVSTGSFKGFISLNDQLEYSITSDVTVLNGEVKGLNLDKMFDGLSKKVSFLGDKVDLKNIGEKFDTLLFKGNLSENIIFVDKLVFDIKNKLKLNVGGKVSMTESKSELKGNVDIAKFKENPIPVLLEGEGFSLIPQAKYTTDKLTERAYKSTLKKEKKKIKSQLEKKAKDLFKGFKL